MPADALPRGSPLRHRSKPSRPREIRGIGRCGRRRVPGRGVGLGVQVAFFVFAGDELHFSPLSPVGVLVGLAGDHFAVLRGDDLGPGLHLGDLFFGGFADVAATAEGEGCGGEREKDDPISGVWRHWRHDTVIGMRQKSGGTDGFSVGESLGDGPISTGAPASRPGLNE